MLVACTPPCRPRDLTSSSHNSVRDDFPVYLARALSESVTNVICLEEKGFELVVVTVATSSVHRRPSVDLFSVQSRRCVDRFSVQSHRSLSTLFRRKGKAS